MIASDHLRSCSGTCWIILVIILGLGGCLALHPCWKNATLSMLDPPACASCRSRCGRVVDFQNQPSCSCDEQCFIYGDCCYDMISECPDEYSSSRRIPDPKKTACQSVTVNSDPEWKFMYMMVSHCKTDPKACTWSTNSPYDFMPVVDTKTGMHYTNVKCAVCNGVEHLVPWKANITCRKINISVAGNRSNNFKTLETMTLIKEAVMKPIKTAQCRLDLFPPAEMKQPRRCLPLTKLESKCPETCENHNLAHACKHLFLNYFHIGKRLYRNHYCALCTSKWRGLRCGVGSGLVRENSDPWPSRFEMNLIFDFDPNDGLRVGESQVSIPKCPKGEQWMNFRCRKIANNPQNPIDFNGSTLCNSEVDKLVMDFLVESIYNITKIHVGVTIIVSSPKVQLLVFSNTTISLNKLSIKKETIRVYANNVIKSFCKANEQFVVSALDIQFRQFNSNCNFLSHDSSEFNILINDSLIIKDTGAIFDKSQWYIDNGTTYICIQHTEQHHKRSIILGILTMILLVISVIALTIRIITHFILVELQNDAGRVQTSLALAMWLAYMALLIGPSQPMGSIGCHIVGVCRHWALLAMFSWMSVVSLDIWRMVWLSSKLFKMQEKRHTFIYFSVFAWMTPAVFITVGEILNFVSTDVRFQPQYGTPLCWFNQRYALMVLFAVPVVLCLIFNTLAFIMCLVLLLRSLGNRASIKSDSNKDYNIILYFKLFILMGLTWILGIVVEITKHVSIDYLYTILNASLGLILTVGTLCFGHVARALSRKIRKAGPARYTRSLSTDSTRSGETKQSTM